MATFQKFDIFVEDLTQKVHDLFGNTTSVDDVSVYLSNTTPSASADSVKTDLAEISTGSGYTGPVEITTTGTRSSGTFTLQGTKVVITASGGSIGPFQYVVLFNDTPSSPTDPLIGWWDRGSALTLNDGESFSIKFNNQDGAGDVFTIA